jgi:protein involved in polysaccharide export with SLBB domain
MPFVVPVSRAQVGQRMRLGWFHLVPLLVFCALPALAQQNLNIPPADTSPYPSSPYGTPPYSQAQADTTDNGPRSSNTARRQSNGLGNNPGNLLGGGAVDLQDAEAQQAMRGLGESLSSDRFFESLAEQPEMLAAVKKATIMRLQAAGLQEQAQALQSDTTDDAFLRRLQQDPDLQMLVMQELRQRGYGVGAAGGAGDDDVEPDLILRDDPLSADAIGRGAGSIYLGSTYGSSSPDRARSARQRYGMTSKEPRAPVENAPEASPLRRPSPYPSLPSLRDLYSQLPSGDAKLKRFGSDIFRYGTGNTEELPMDLPAGPEYVLGPGDGLIINLWGNVSRRIARTVDRQGQVALPEAGSIVVAGQSISQAEQAMEQALIPQFRKVRVEISLARLRAVRVYVVGDVQRPGAYDISSLSTPLNALYAAGGPTSRGSLRTVQHYRGHRLVREVDLYDFLLHGIRPDAVDTMQSGDTILVPPVGSQVTVTGTVRRPAIYELKDEKDLNSVLDLAGGVLVSANLRQVMVERIEAHERHVMLSVRLQETAIKVASEKNRGTFQNAATKIAVETDPGTFQVQDGDRVIVAPILPYSDKTVYLQGHVFRPGKYPFHEGMTVNELMQSYQDVLPEPADHAEIVRLQPPDFRPTTLSFNLTEVLTGDDPIVLQPFDVIRVYSRYEGDGPKVHVIGEVVRPGEYPLARGMTAAGLVQMAGGFRRSAFKEQAELSSYVIQNGEKVLVKDRVIDMRKAIEGDEEADAKLKPGDVVTVPQLTGWTDIGASVTVQGEVTHAGTYGITEGERLSSVLKRVGGFRETAYPAGAVLERVQVRELGEKTRSEMIRRVETINPTLGGLQAAQERLVTLQAMEQQRQQVLLSLRSHPASGRLVIRISADLKSWENTPADIEMRAGDVLVIPKRPNFVMVSGQVYNATAITYAPGKDAGKYLRQAGGPTQTADKKGIFIVRADGSVQGRGESLGGFWKESVLSTRLQPGDAVVVPEKIKGGSLFWKEALAAGQTVSGFGLTAALALR